MNDTELIDQLRVVLGGAADRMPVRDLSGPAMRQARRIRTRRRAGVVAAAVVVGAAVPAGVAVVDDDGEGRPAATGEETETTAPLVDIDERALLEDGDVNPIGSYTGFRRTDSASMTQNFEEQFCLPKVIGLDTRDVQLGAWFSPGNEGSVHEAVLEMSSVETAEAFVNGQRRLPDQCGGVSPTHEQTVNQPVSITVDGADEALAWTIDDRPLPDDPGSEGSFRGAGLARVDNLVVMVGFGAFGDPTGDWDAWASRTAGIALQRATSD